MKNKKKNLTTVPGCVKLDVTSNNLNIGKITFDGPPCSNCGAIMQPAGKCHVCPCCGNTNGCS